MDYSRVDMWKEGRPFLDWREASRIRCWHAKFQKLKKYIHLAFQRVIGSAGQGLEEMFNLGKHSLGSYVIKQWEKIAAHDHCVWVKGKCKFSLLKILTVLSFEIDRNFRTFWFNHTSSTVHFFPSHFYPCYVPIQLFFSGWHCTGCSGSDRKMMGEMPVLIRDWLLCNKKAYVWFGWFRAVRWNESNKYALSFQNVKNVDMHYSYCISGCN